MDINELLTTYKVISFIMKNNKLNSDNAWRHVQSWLSNKICDQLIENKFNEIKE